MLTNASKKILEELFVEKSPSGWEDTVLAMKDHPDIDNPWALAWSMKNKGYKSHKNSDGSDKKSKKKK